MLVFLLSGLLAHATPAIEASGDAPTVETEAEVRRPVRANLDGLPYAQTDFTAYAVEPGAVRVGLTNLTLGVLPRVHLSTIYALDAVGVANAGLKWNVLRVGPVDLALSGGFGLRDDQRGFYLRLLRAGAHASVRLLEPWSVHVAVSRHSVTHSGVPWMLSAVLPPSHDPSAAPPRSQVDAWTFEAATDLRLNRRDAIVFRVRAMDAGMQAALGDALSMGGAEVALSHKVSPGGAWIASLGWQLSWRTLQLRLGAATTSHPDLRLLPSVDMTLWFGGQTRRGEREALSAWRAARRE